MPHNAPPTWGRTGRDLTASVVVFLVALPLCLGIALASGAPLISGILAGIIGGIVVGSLSGSHTSVSGPAAGMIAVVAAQIHSLGSFETFLLAVCLAGLLQVVMGLGGAGFLASFFPTSVIKGLLAAIGIIIVLKQIPHVLGHDADPEGEMAFFQPDQHNTFSEFLELVGDLHPGAAVIGISSFALLLLWEFWKPLKKLPLPAPLVVVALAVAASQWFAQLGAPWAIESSHLVQVPEVDSLTSFANLLQFPAWHQWTNPAVYFAALTIALVASLETLINLEAVDRIDPRQRVSPPNRELMAQGVGNLASGLLGGLPITSVIVRSSVNINAGAQTKRSAVAHGVLLLACVALLPAQLNTIPLACLAAILLATGVKLASPLLFQQMWRDGRYQFVPFLATVLAIVFTDLIVGVLMGLAISMAFILNSSLRRPLRRILEQHLDGDVLHIRLANQVSFLNRASLERALNEIPRDGHVLLDATETDYVDPDILSLLREFRDRKAPARGIRVSLRGFRPKYHLDNTIQYVDYTTQDLQQRMTPQQVLQMLQDGNARFREGRRLSRDLGQQMHRAAEGQHPLAVILSCIDSRTAVELVFDAGLGTLFSVRIAGNIISAKVLGSIEFACAVAGTRLVIVMGHTRCGAVTNAVQFQVDGQNVLDTTGCQHLETVLRDIQRCIDPVSRQRLPQMDAQQRRQFIDDLARKHAREVADAIPLRSAMLSRLVSEGRIAVVAAFYDIETGVADFFHTARVPSELAAETV